MPTSRGKRATSRKSTARSKLGLTKRSVKDLPAAGRRSDAVKGGAVKRVWKAGNDQPPD